MVLKGLKEEKAMREKNFEILVETLKISELEADLAQNAFEETQELRTSLSELERKYEMAVLENEKLRVKLPRMEQLMSQKARDFDEAKAQNSSKIMQLQSEVKLLECMLRRCKKCFKLYNDTFYFR